MRNLPSLSPAWGVLIVTATLFADTAVTGAGPRPNPLSGQNTRALESARAGATTRLRKPECQMVLTDFADTEGHSLKEDLDARGQSATDYLQTIAFVDGSSTRSCRLGDWVLLVARPGSGSVGVCPMDGRPFTSRLAQLQLRNPALAESMVIHEMLHTLGLGENPPTSEEITRQVQRRCGS
jgi:hypothetical protein